MLIYCKHITKRLEYTLDFLIKQLIGVDYYLTDDRNAFATSKTDVKICYDQHNLGGFHIQSTSLLFEKDIKKITLKRGKWQNTETILQTNGDIPFDIFSATFFLVTRYEEYWKSNRDEHNRYSSKSSIAYKHRFLHQPIINIWAEQLKNELKLKSTSENSYESIITFDIDSTFAFKGKGKKRIILGYCKDLLNLKFTQLLTRIKSINNTEKDPHNRFTFIFNLLEKYTIENPIFFFLNGAYAKYDKNLPIDSTLQINIIKRCGNIGEIGIHPSYQSNEKPNLLQNEIESLENIISEPIIKSRQHYLMLRFPDTYQKLISNHILQDYTLGYAENLGFRASTCTPFYWFDLSKNEQTTLKIFPLGIMDGTLKTYLKLTDKQAVEESKKHINWFKKYNGTFVLLWHNTSFNPLEGWKGWDIVFEKILAYSNEN